METFKSLGIEEKWRANLGNLSISEPTIIQEKVIPIVIYEEKDIVAQAKTGSGKTFAFGLPILQKMTLINS